MLIELYATAVHGAHVEHNELGFITSNVRDFSAADDHRKPHPDIAELFTDDGSSSYFKGVEGIALALQEHFGEEFDELVEESDFEEEPRTLAEIQEAEQEFFSISLVRAAPDVPPPLRAR